MYLLVSRRTALIHTRFVSDAGIRVPYFGDIYKNPGNDLNRACPVLQPAACGLDLTVRATGVTRGLGLLGLLSLSCIFVFLVRCNTTHITLRRSGSLSFASRVAKREKRVKQPIQLVG